MVLMLEADFRQIELPAIGFYASVLTFQYSNDRRVTP